MKIAIIQTPLISQAGGERQALELAVNLQRKGHKVTIFTPYYSKESCYPELIKKIDVLSLRNNLVADVEKGISSNKLLKFLYIFRHYKNFFVMKKLGEMIDNSYDVINPHNMPTHWAAFFAARRIKKPIIWMCNEPPFWYLEKNNILKKLFNFPLFPLFDKYSVNFISNIIVLDKLNKERVKSIYNRDSLIVYSGINIKKKMDNNISSKIENKGLTGKFIILVISTLAPYKRPLLAVSAFVKFIKKHKDAHLVIIGKGDLKDQILKIIKEYKLEKSFTLLKDLTEQELTNIYQLANVFLFPAIQTWGLVVVEAMVNKVPVIVEEKSGVAEIIEHKKIGFKVDFENTERVVDYMEKIYKDRKMGKQIGETAHTFVNENFSWDRYSEKMFEEFNNLK